MRAVQRQILISSTGAYRTTSWESLCVIAGVIPVDFLLREREARYQLRVGRDAEIRNVVVRVGEVQARTRIRDEANKLWQIRWESSERGSTTAVFFRDIPSRLEARWVQVDH